MATTSTRSHARAAGRPSKALKETLGTWTADHSEKLLSAVIKTLIAGNTCVIVRTHYCMDFPPGFPLMGIKCTREGTTDIRRIGAATLLRWLQDSGYTTMTTGDILSAVTQFNHFEQELFNGTPPT